MAVSEKGSSNDKMSIVWEKKYDEFKDAWKCRREEPRNILGKAIS